MKSNKFTVGSSLEWLDNHQSRLDRYLLRFPLADRQILRNYLYDDPISACMIIRDSILSNKAKYFSVLRDIFFKYGNIVNVLGKKGSGKTGTIMSLCFSYIKVLGGKRPIILFNQFKKPPWAKIAYSTDAIPTGAIVINDEASITADSRDHKKKKFFS